MPSRAQFCAAPTVRHAAVDGLRVILDLRTERYRVLDDAATSLWSVLTGEDEGVAPERGEIADDGFEADLAEFANRCVQEGLLQPAPPPRAPAAPPVPRSRNVLPRTARALLCMLRTQRSLRRDGFARTYDTYARVPVATVTPDLAPALSSFVRAENVFIARRAPNDCLTRSLALYRFLRSGGVAAEHVIGVRRLRSPRTPGWNATARPCSTTGRERSRSWRASARSEPRGERLSRPLRQRHLRRRGPARRAAGIVPRL